MGRGWQVGGDSSGSALGETDNREQNLIALTLHSAWALGVGYLGSNPVFLMFIFENIGRMVRLIFLI